MTASLGRRGEDRSKDESRQLRKPRQDTGGSRRLQWQSMDGTLLGVQGSPQRPRKLMSFEFLGLLDAIVCIRTHKNDPIVHVRVRWITEPRKDPA